MQNGSDRGYWLVKSEPEVFSFEDLMASPRQTTMWEGVRNYQARNFMRDAMRIGDKVLFYHSSTQLPGIAGIAEVASEAYADPTQFDHASPFHDPRASMEEPRWYLVDIRGLEPLPRFISLAELRTRPELADMPLLRRGNRLSIQPLRKTDFLAVLTLAREAS